eukprot:scaffold235890_cov33-Tisochrysis_lutea.AAC.1
MAGYPLHGGGEGLGEIPEAASDLVATLADLYRYHLTHHRGPSPRLVSHQPTGTGRWRGRDGESGAFPPTRARDAPRPRRELPKHKTKIHRSRAV